MYSSLLLRAVSVGLVGHLFIDTHIGGLLSTELADCSPMGITKGRPCELMCVSTVPASRGAHKHASLFAICTWRAMAAVPRWLERTTCTFAPARAGAWEGRVDGLGIGHGGLRAGSRQWLAWGGVSAKVTGRCVGGTAAQHFSLFF